VVQAVKKILCAAEERVAKATDALAIQLVDWCVEFHRTGGPPAAVLLS
jgi:hypothetical protein